MYSSMQSDGRSGDLAWDTMGFACMEPDDFSTGRKGVVHQDKCVQFEHCT